MRILFVDRVHEVLEQMLLDAGHDCHHGYDSDRAAIEQKLAGYHGIVIRSRIPIDRKFLAAAPNLRFIARAGAGLENIDLEAAQEQNVQVFSVPEANRDAVGEHAVGMLLMLLNHLKKADAEVRNGIWKRAENRGTEIGGKTVGIIGFGQMGSAFAEKLRGFNCRILAYDKYHQNAPDYVQHVKLKTLQNEADIISFHTPLTDETKYYLNDEFVANCAKPFYLINTARGPVVETSALVRGLKSGKIAGACLDVLEYEARSFEKLHAENLPDDFRYLTTSEQVILSPHIAGWTHESHYKLSRFLGDKILTYFQRQNK